MKASELLKAGQGLVKEASDGCHCNLTGCPKCKSKLNTKIEFNEEHTMLKSTKQASMEKVALLQYLLDQYKQLAQAHPDIAASIATGLGGAAIGGLGGMAYGATRGYNRKEDKGLLGRMLSSGLTGAGLGGLAGAAGGAAAQHFGGQDIAGMAGAGGQYLKDKYLPEAPAV